MFRPQSGGTNAPPNPLEGLPPDPPFPAFDLQNDLGRGYWIRVVDPAVLRPRLVTTVRPDIDAEPQNNFPSKEDFNVSGGTRVKKVEEQDVIRFFPGEDLETVGVANLGDNGTGGGGILLWEAIWTPVTDTTTPEPWIRLFSSPDQREQRDQNGQLVTLYTNLTGVTTLENDTIYLRLDRKNLGRGTHEGNLLLRTSVGDKSYHVIAEVPGLEGDFQGAAVVQSVNGKRNPVPDIDLNVSFYEDSKVQGLLRGLIDSSQALLWPVDVPLVGYRVADDGNRFMLSGSMVLPPGDQNGEPYDRWDENDPTAGADVDWLNDGVLDVRNPFPSPIQRTVSLEGSLIAANPTDGYVLEGNYRELVYGMSREPIRLAGTFHLERKAARPLSSRRSVTQDTGVEPVIQKLNNLPVVIPSGTTGESAVSVKTEMELRSLQVSLSFNAPLAHSALFIKLVSPAATPVELTLYDGRTAAATINPKLLEAVTFPLDRPTAGDFDQFLRDVPRTQTDSGHFWKVVIQNAGPQSVTLANWTLRLEGQPVADVFGVVKNGNAPLAGARVALDGAPFSLYSGLTDNQGRFFLSRVPLLPLNFSATLPGYLPADPAVPGLSGDFTRPFVRQAGLTFTALETSLIARFNPLPAAPVALAGVPGFSSGTTNSPFELNLRPEAAGSPRIAAGPLTAFVGSTIEFVAVNAAASVSWDFEDQNSANTAAATHAFQSPGLYRVKLFSPSGSSTLQDTVDVVVLPSPGHAPSKPSDLKGEPTGLDPQTAAAAYTAYMFQPFSTAGGVLPAHLVGTDPNNGEDRYLSDITPRSSFGPGETNVFGAAYVASMPLQMAYSATMDIDLAPHISPADTTKPFQSDGFTPLNEPGFDVSVNVNNQGFKQEDFNYALVASLWQNTRASDGSVEYSQDVQNGLIVWGNPLVTPNINYSTQTAEAKDGGSFAVALDDDLFHPHSGTTLLPDLATFQTVTHYRMTCSLSAAILTAPTTGASVKAAKLSRGQPENPLDPVLQPASQAVAQNLYFQLQTGFLGTAGIAP
jgi:PKD repeat protein